MLNDRRGDLMLLINGMPVIHIELKRSGVPVSQAYNQIEKYSYEGVFTGLFSLVQVFVAMNPEETRYFANPGPDGKFNTDYYFHWADFNNEEIHDWKRIAANLLGRRYLGIEKEDVFAGISRARREEIENPKTFATFKKKIPDIVKAESHQPDCFICHDETEDRLPFLD